MKFKIDDVQYTTCEECGDGIPRSCTDCRTGEIEHRPDADGVPTHGCVCCKAGNDDPTHQCDHIKERLKRDGYNRRS